MIIYCNSDSPKPIGQHHNSRREGGGYMLSCLVVDMKNTLPLVNEPNFHWHHENHIALLR